MRNTTCNTLSALIATATCLFFLPRNLARAEDRSMSPPTSELKQNEVVLYDQEEFKENGSRVKHIIVTETEAGTLSNLRDLDMNDCISSLRWNLEPGIELTFYEHGDGRGREYKINGTGEDGKLKDKNFSNVASSFRWTRTDGANTSKAQDTKPSKTFIDYFLPIPINGALSKEAWGAATVGPRDQKNGLEDATMKDWNYWDGKIIKGPDGKYHMFASRWEQTKGHRGWSGSKAVHAVSDNLTGPYEDRGLCWPNDAGGKGHNVTAFQLPDGRYAILISETRPGTVFVSNSLDGPWEVLGNITVADDPKWRASNEIILPRPDGRFEMFGRRGVVMLSDNVLGPYVAQGPSIYLGIEGLPKDDLRHFEDPVLWYSGDLYHIVVNSWSQRKAYHLTSKDGITGWTYRGLAYDPTVDFIRYTDGTVNRWTKLERPSVYIENGHVAAVTLDVIDVQKEEQKGNDGHGSKIIVIPFDGAALDRDLQEAAK